MKRNARPYLMTIRSATREDGGLLVEGIANRASTTDSFKTRFLWTANCVDESRGGIILFNHEADNPVGRNREMETRDGDLWVQDFIDGDAVTPYQRSIPDLIEKGILDGLSVRFDNEAEYKRFPGDDFTTITPNHLVEHSIVTLPSNRESVMGPMMRGVLDELERTEEGRQIATVIRIGWASTGGNLVEDDADTVSQRAWSAPRLKDFTSKSWGELTDAEVAHIKSFFLYAPADASKFGDLKLPYKDPETGKVSLDALKAAASRLPNTDIPESDKKSIGAKIASEMKALGSEYTGEYAPDRAMDMRPAEVRGAGPLDFDTLRDRLEDAVEDAWKAAQPMDGGYHYWCPRWVSFVYDEFCIVYDYSEAAWYQVPYTVDENGVVALGVYQLVLMDWKPVQGNGENEPEAPEPGEALVPRGISKEDLLQRMGVTVEASGEGAGEEPLRDVFRRALEVS